MDGTWAGVQPRQGGPRQRAEARRAPAALGSLGPRNHWALALPDPTGGLLGRFSGVTGADFTLTRPVSFPQGEVWVWARSSGLESVRPCSDAGPSADQLCDLCLALGPHLSSGNTNVVRSLCPQAWKEGLSTGPGT